MFIMCIDRGYVVTGERKLCSVCVLTEGVLVYGRECYEMNVYGRRVRWYRG